MNSEIKMGKIGYFFVLLTLIISNQAEIKGNMSIYSFVSIQASHEKLERLTYKVVIQSYLDDVEAIYKSQYEQVVSERNNEERKHKEKYLQKKGRRDPYEPLYPKPADWPSNDDPKAIRIQKRQDMWDYFTIYLPDQKYIKDILKEMKSEFCRVHNPPIAEDEPWTLEMEMEFKSFRVQLCYSIGVASEAGSFLVHGGQAFDLFKGRLKQLNVFGLTLDKYLLPVINALVPLVDKNISPVIFEVKKQL